MACGSANRNNGEKAIDISNFETSVAPSEDFYRYVTGGWQKRILSNPNSHATAHSTVFAKTTNCA